MSAAFIYLAIGAIIIGLFKAPEAENEPLGYVVVLMFWPFLAITVAASMIGDAVRRAIGDA